MDLVVGIGQDSHRFDAEGKKGLIIGGVELANETKLEGNSDGDVVLHAVFNAISSALGGRSISITADPMCLEQGITDSREYLKVLVSQMITAGYRVNNISLSIECKRPKIEPIVNDMKGALSELLQVESGRIGITATSGEGLTDFGRGEGVQCLVTVSLVR